MPDTTATLQSRRGCRRFRHLVRSQQAKAGEEPIGHLRDYGTSLWEWSPLLNVTIGRVTEAQVTLKRHCQKGWCGAKSHWWMYQGGRKKELQSPAAHCRSWVDTVLQPSPVGFSFWPSNSKSSAPCSWQHTDHNTRTFAFKPVLWS